MDQGDASRGMVLNEPVELTRNAIAGVVKQVGRSNLARPEPPKPEFRGFGSSNQAEELCLEGKSRGDLSASRVGSVREPAGCGSIAYTDPGLDNVAGREVSVADHRSIADGIEDVEDFKAQPQIHGLADREQLGDARVQVIGGVDWDTGARQKRHPAGSAEGRHHSVDSGAGSKTRAAQAAGNDEYRIEVLR